MRTSIATVVLILAVVASACATTGEGDDVGAPTAVTAPQPSGAPDTTADGTSTTVAPSATASGLPDGPSALQTIDHPDLPTPLVDPSEIISGGPPPDGIPPIDDPAFVTTDEADEWLNDAEPVVYLEIEGDVHAYPVQVLIWHEIVNDIVGGLPVSVTYCPLCNSAVSYARVIDGVETTFGTSGRLFASALVMYDRATESLWTHFDGLAVAGVLTGRRLDPIPSPLIAWSDFKAAFPDAEVLDRNATGHQRDYGRNPYVGYDDPSANPFLFRGALDDRAQAMQRVVGVLLGDQSRAWTLDALSEGESTATNTEVGGTPIVILWRAGQSTALEDATVDGGRDVGSVGAFSAKVDGATLTFVASEGRFVDEQTGSTWDITGTAVDGDLEGTRLEPVHHLDTFWFAWSTYQPGTEIIED
jgi:hypothetical protein